MTKQRSSWLPAFSWKASTYKYALLTRWREYL